MRTRYALIGQVYVSYYIRHSKPGAPTVDPDKKVGGGKKMNQILGDYDAFLFPFILSHPLLFVPPLKPVLCP